MKIASQGLRNKFNLICKLATKKNEIIQSIRYCTFTPCGSHPSRYVSTKLSNYRRKEKCHARSRSAPEDSTTEQSFNEALKEETDDKLRFRMNKKLKSFLLPKTITGELIVPVDSPVCKPSSPAIIVPRDSPGQVIDLAPTDLAIYKVVRGDTLWGIARKNNVSLADCCKPTLTSTKVAVYPSVRRL